MLSNLISIFAVPVVLYLLSIVFESVSAWVRGNRIVARSPIPSVTIYTPLDSVIFWILSPYIAPYLEALPFGLGNWVRFVKKNYSWDGKGDYARDHLKSDVWWAVGPGGLKLHIMDPELFAEVAGRGKDFPKQNKAYEVMNIFGRNVLSTEGKEWQMHRKITAPPFSERNNSLVFVESMRQAEAMLYSFTHDSDGMEMSLPIYELSSWTMMIALFVIVRAGFGLQMKWPVRSVAEPKTLSSKDSGMTFTRAVHIVATDIFSVLIFPKWFLRNSPKVAHRELLEATEIFHSELHKMVEEAEHDKGSGSDLLTSLVGSAKGEMTRDEIVGNLFIIIIAGHETTAAAVQTLFVVLAIEQEIQDGILQEIDEIFPVGHDFDYAEDWPKMKTIMAAVFEVLRLFPPIVNFPKTTNGHQTATYKSQTFDIPAGTTVTCDVIAMNRHLKSWAPDPHVFRLSRWIVDDDSVPAKHGILLHEGLYRPSKGSFSTFSEGARNCLGRKFAFVEMGTVLATMLRNHRVELVDKSAAGLKEACRRLDERKTVLAMRMVKEVEIKFVRRK